MGLALEQSRSVDSVISHSDPRWVRLRSMIEELSLLRGQFILSSGRKSTYLFQLRQTTMHPEGQFLIGSIISEFMQLVGARSVGGLELGAVPVVTAVSFASHIQGHPVKAFFVRKKAKEHGAKELVDGHVDRDGDVLFVDDVTTSGASVFRAIETANAEFGRPLRVSYVLSVLDREEGAAEFLGARGIQLVSIFKKRDFDL